MAKCEINYATWTCYPHNQVLNDNGECPRKTFNPRLISGNTWMKTVGHRGCLFPCHGHPVLKTRPGEVRLAADDMPAYLACSECGYTPLPELQPMLVERYLSHWLKAHRVVKSDETSQSSSRAAAAPVRRSLRRSTRAAAHGRHRRHSH